MNARRHWPAYLPDHGSPESRISRGRGLPTAGVGVGPWRVLRRSTIMEGCRRPADRGAAGARHGEVDDLHRGVHHGMYLAQHAPYGGPWYRADDPAWTSSGNGLGPRSAGPGHQPVRAERGESLAHPDRDTDRRAGAGAGATAGRVAGGGHADRARAVRLPAGPGLPARLHRPEAVRPGASRRRLVPDRVRAAADLCVPGPRPMAALADGGPTVPPGQAAARAQAMVEPAAPAGGRGG